MLTAKITSKGQITVPIKIRKKLGVESGERLSFEEFHGGFIIRKVLKKSPFDRWVGTLDHLQGKDPDELIGEMRDQ